MIVQLLEGEPSGKAKKYERTGPQEFVHFSFDDVTIENIKEACNQHFEERIPQGMVCDILATDRGPSCSRTDQLPSLKLVNVRFKKSGSFLPSGRPLETSSRRVSNRFKPSTKLTPRFFQSEKIKSTVLPQAPIQKKEFAASIPVSKMLRLGQVVTEVLKTADSILVSDFCLESMKWRNLNSIGYVIDDEPFDRGAFREAYKAKITPNGATYVIKKYLKETYDDLKLFDEKPEDHAKKSVQMHCLAKHFATQLKVILRAKGYSGDVFAYNMASFGILNGQPVTIENFIAGTFVKYINNDGEINSKNIDKKKQEMAECLTHFSYIKSQTTMMLVDIQGCNFDLYDPEIATISGAYDDNNKLLFCMGNQSEVARNTFFAGHECNEFCKLVQLPIFKDTDT